MCLEDRLALELLGASHKSDGKWLLQKSFVPGLTSTRARFGDHNTLTNHYSLLPFEDPNVCMCVHLYKWAGTNTQAIRMDSPRETPWSL